MTVVKNIEELQEAIRQLSSVGREIITEWLREFMVEEDYRAADPAAAYGARPFDEREEMTMTAWLRCRLNSGMSSDEVAVTYPAASKYECAPNLAQ